MNAILGQALRRYISKSAVSSAQIQGTAATSGSHEAGGYKVWKRLTYFVAMPAVLVCLTHAVVKHQEEHDVPRPEFIKYEHLRVRNKRFPWGEGNKSLFHNAHTTPLPDGYEVVEGAHH